MRQPYPSYRPSGVEWLGAVPEHWKVTRLSRVTACLDGRRVPLNAEERSHLRGDYPYWGANGILDHLDDWLFDEALVLLGEDGAPFFDQNKCVAFAVSGRIWVNNHAHVLQPTHIHQRFLAHSLNITDYAPFIDGSTRDKLTQGDMNRIPLLMPPTDEQHMIVEFLDSETAKIDTLLAKERQLIERLDEYRATLIAHTVTKGLPTYAAAAAGLDPSPRLRPSGVDWLGEIPEHWAVQRLKWSVSDTVNGVWGDEPDGKNDVPCVRVADFDRRKFRVNLAQPTLRSITPSQRRGRDLKPGDLLLEKSGGGEKQMVGCVVLYDHDAPAVCSNFIARVSGHKNTDARFWTYMHAALYSGRLNYPAIKQTTGIQNLDSDAYFNTLTVFPPLSEQRAIAEFLDQETERIDTLSSRVETAIERLQEYRTALITAAVTGKIDVRDWQPAGTGAGRA